MQPVCSSLGPHTYSLRIASSTIPEALCKLSHDLNEYSYAYCIRHHPHDEHVEMFLEMESMQSIIAEFNRRLKAIVISRGEDEFSCSAHCDSFWSANVVRRALWQLVPTVACVQVRVLVNTSQIDDCMIAHRCGQLAIAGDACETKGEINVEGRAALGGDIKFSGPLSVVPSDLSAPVVLLDRNEAFEAELLFKRGTPLEHAKFHCVASPEYYPDVSLEREPHAEESALLHPDYVVDASLRVTRADGLPCRKETIDELVPTLPIRLGPRVRVGVESLGQRPAVECVLCALQCLADEAENLVAEIRKCDNASLHAAIGAASQS